MAPSYRVPREQTTTTRAHATPAAATTVGPTRAAGGHAVAQTANQGRDTTAAATTASSTRAAGGHATAPKRDSQTDKPTYADVTATAPSTTGHATGSGAAGSGEPEKVMSAAERMAKDDMAVDDGDDEVCTIPEELPVHRLNILMLNLHKKITAKEKQLEKELAAIHDQQDEIAAHQARLVELQATADSTRETISDFNDTRAELSQRLAKAAATQNIPTKPVPETDGKEKQVETAMDCLSRTFMGLQKYEEQSPEVKALLCQFAQAFQSLQAASTAPVLPVGQLTLQQAFLTGTSTGGVPSQVISTPQCAGGAGVDGTRTDIVQSTATSPEQFTISSGATTPAGEAKVVETERAGAPTKSYGRAPNAHESPVPVRPPAELRPADEVVREAEGSSKDVAMVVTETAMVLWEPPPRHLTRTQLREELERKNEDQANRIRKRVAAAAAHRVSPY